MSVWWAMPAAALFLIAVAFVLQASFGYAMTHSDKFAAYLLATLFGLLSLLTFLAGTGEITW